MLTPEIMICTLDLQYSNKNDDFDHPPINVPLTPVFVILLSHIIILYFICLLRHCFLFFTENIHFCFPTYLPLLWILIPFEFSS